MYLQKVISRKIVLKISFFAGILKVNDENSRIRIQDPDPNPDPDPLVRGMDPRIRIRPKISWIQNTASGDTLKIQKPPGTLIYAYIYPYISKISQSIW